MKTIIKKIEVAEYEESLIKSKWTGNENITFTGEILVNLLMGQFTSTMLFLH
jgi:hypothetical protein